MDPPSADATQVSPASGVPRTTRLFAVVVSLLTGLTVVPVIGEKVRGTIALVPQAFIGSFYLWNIQTAGFVEPQALRAVVTVPCVVLLGKWMEPIWGGREFAIFVITVNLFAGMVSFAFLFTLYVVTHAQEYIFAPVGGLSAVVLGLLVALKQISPQHRISAGGVGLAMNFVPAVALGATLALFFASGLSVGDLVFSLTGFYISWLYLRFFQRREVGRGDLSEGFAFHTFLPHPVAPVVRIIGSIVFIVFRPILMSGQSRGSGSGTLTEKTPPTVSTLDAVDAERRRQRALRALDARLVAEDSNVGDGQEV